MFFFCNLSFDVCYFTLGSWQDASAISGVMCVVDVLFLLGGETRLTFPTRTAV